jgi:hypothetical protein
MSMSGKAAIADDNPLLAVAVIIAVIARIA